MSATDSTEHTRRDFLYVATGVAGAVGAAGVAWPFIDQMQPDASTRALASIQVDVSGVEPGMSLTVKWRGRPVFIRNRTEKEIEEARAVALEDLKDPVARNANIAADAPRLSAVDAAAPPLAQQPPQVVELAALLAKGARQASALAAEDAWRESPRGTGPDRAHRA